MFAAQRQDVDQLLERIEDAAFVFDLPRQRQGLAGIVLGAVQIPLIQRQQGLVTAQGAQLAGVVELPVQDIGLGQVIGGLFEVAELAPGAAGHAQRGRQARFHAWGLHCRNQPLQKRQCVPGSIVKEQCSRQVVAHRHLRNRRVRITLGQGQNALEMLDCRRELSGFGEVNGEIAQHLRQVLVQPFGLGQLQREIHGFQCGDRIAAAVLQLRQAHQQSDTVARIVPGAHFGRQPVDFQRLLACVVHLAELHLRPGAAGQQQPALGNRQLRIEGQAVVGNFSSRSRVGILEPFALFDRFLHRLRQRRLQVLLECR